MNPTAVYTVVFSPTGTSRKIAAAVAQGVARHGGSCNATANAAAVPDAGTNAAAGSAAKAFTTIDLTHAAGKPPVLPADAAAVFAVPVYGGRVAPAALERLQEIRGEGTPAVVLAVYGNRAFGTAVAQLAAFVAERGFVPVAWANTRTARPARRSPKDVPMRRTSPKRPLSERASAKSLRTERPARSTPQNSANRIRRCCQNCGSSVSCWGTAGGRNALRPYCSPRATPHGAPNAAAASRSVPRRRSRAATNCTPTRRAASAAAHASKAARSAHARSGRLSPPFCRATSPGANHP